jgi:hypothetical protein
MHRKRHGAENIHPAIFMPWSSSFACGFAALGFLRSNLERSVEAQAAVPAKKRPISRMEK